MTKTTSAASRLKITNQHLAGHRFQSSSSIQTTAISSVNQNSKFTKDYKNYAVYQNKIISYFHDVPLEFDPENKTVNMVVEIPRWTNGKFEISTELPGNPIVQDVKKGQVRFVKNLFPNHGYIHNYGALPQTWEDPTTLNEDLQLYGDNDPLDVCEIGSLVGSLGEIKKVKILGSLALIDDGELDWKIIAIDVNDPLCQELSDIHDVFVKCPGYLETTRQWFKDYKLPDGKPENKFAFNGKYKNQQETLEVVQECMDAWGKLINNQAKGDNLPSIANTSQVGTPGYVSKYDVIIDPVVSQVPDGKIDPSVNKNYFNSQQ